MKVCILAREFPVRSETFIYEHATSLVDAGHEVFVISGCSGSNIQQVELNTIEAYGIKNIYHDLFNGSPIARICKFVCACKFNIANLFRGFKGGSSYRDGIYRASEQKKLIQQIKPDVVHVHYGSIALFLALVGLKHKCVVVTWHGYDANVLPKRHGMRMYDKLALHNWSHTVGSDFMRFRLINLGIDSGSIYKVPMGVRLDRFNYKSRAANHQRITQIISVGRLDEMKGHEYLIRSIALLRAQGISTYLRIIGGGALEGSLKSLVNELDLQDYVELLGAQPSDVVLEYLYASDIFALAGVVAEDGRVETQGVVFVEAQGTGLPVVACDVGGVSESLIDGETGLLCDSKDIKSIASALGRLIDDSDLRAHYGLKGREFAVEKFSIHSMKNLFLKIYTNDHKNGNCS